MKHCDILIIDDDYDDVEILTEVLNKGGMDNVHYVHSAKEALQYLEDTYPDCIPKVIVTDVFLPGVTGAEFINQLQAMDQFKDIKVVILSSAKSPKQIEMLRELGHLDYFVKPNSIDEYHHIVESIRGKITV
jgi:CheY-like chemotaxis protein